MSDSDFCVLFYKKAKKLFGFFAFKFLVSLDVEINPRFNRGIIKKRSNEEPPLVRGGSREQTTYPFTGGGAYDAIIIFSSPF